jgi:decaprenyl-phosphate phosphoribosyltransferase
MASAVPTPQLVEAARSSPVGADNASDPPLPNGSLGWRLVGGIKSLRPHQWVKNLFVLAPVFFAKDIFKQELLVCAFGAFGVFCLLASAVYTINDLVDIDADRAHPVKRFRPIASGRLPAHAAKAMAAGLLVLAFAGVFYGPLPFAAVSVAYFLLNVAYSFKLKKIAYLDVTLISTGFVLRVVAGGFATGIQVSWYLLVCTALLALFLGFGKRRHELAQAACNAAKKQRTALQAYTPHALTAALAVTGVATVVTYVAYTLDSNTREVFESDWLWLTTPCVLFGGIRFVQLVAGRPKGESPTQEMLRDVPFVLNLVVWVIVVLAIVYRLRPSE